jgi:hypothetical protein
MAIELDRRFVECREGEQSDPDVIAQYGLADGSLGWTDLLRRRRVVFLAEAGSGKTTEMKARSRLLAESGQPAFYATVEDVGRKGLERALRPADRPALEQDAFSLNMILFHGMSHVGEDLIKMLGP